MKAFVKYLSKDKTCFMYLCQMFPGLSAAKLKENVIMRPDTWKLIYYAEFWVWWMT